MKEDAIQAKRNNTLDELDIAEMKVNFQRQSLKGNLDMINQTLRILKKTRKVISSLTYLKSTWLKKIDYESQLKEATSRLKDFSNLYKIQILERKLLKNEFKQAQRILAKKQKRMKAFDEKYFPKGD